MKHNIPSIESLRAVFADRAPEARAIIERPTGRTQLMQSLAHLIGARVGARGAIAVLLRPQQQQPTIACDLGRKVRITDIDYD